MIDDEVFKEVFTKVKVCVLHPHRPYNYAIDLGYIHITRLIAQF